MAGAMHSSDLDLQPTTKTTIMKKQARLLNMGEWLNEKKLFMMLKKCFDFTTDAPTGVVLA